MTLWLVTILAVLAVAIGRYLSLEVRITKYRLAREQARVLARGGVYLAMQRLADDLEEPEPDGTAHDWLGDDWATVSEPDPEGKMTIRITDEERKLSLNTASKIELARLTGDETVAQVIVDARDEPAPEEEQSSAEPTYLPKNGPFAASEELGDLPGMTPERYDLLMAGTSPYTAGDPVNLNTVTPEVLRAMGVSESAVWLIMRFREGPDGSDAHDEDGVFREAGITILHTLKDQAGVDLTGTDDGNLLIAGDVGVSSRTFTVVSEGIVERPTVRVRVEAVIRRAGCGEGAPSPCIIAWREG